MKDIVLELRALAGFGESAKILARKQYEFKRALESEKEESVRAPTLDFYNNHLCQFVREQVEALKVAIPKESGLVLYEMKAIVYPAGVSRNLQFNISLPKEAKSNLTGHLLNFSCLIMSLSLNNEVEFSVPLDDGTPDPEPFWVPINQVTAEIVQSQVRRMFARLGSGSFEKKRLELITARRGV